jgi:hypothetical protein
MIFHNNRFKLPKTAFLFSVFFLFTRLVSAETIGIPDAPPGYASGNMGESFYEKATVEILTVEPGVHVPDVWGHSAIHVYDPRINKDVVFDYGMFYFGVDFGWQYIMGVPTYWLGVRTLEDTMSFFKSERRAIKAQRLNLSLEQKKIFLDSLYYNAHPDHRYYHYHHFDDNCTTRVRDLLDRAVDGALKKETEAQSAGITFRKRSMNLVNDPLTSIGLHLMLNKTADQNINGWQNMFLPVELMNGLSHSQLSSTSPSADGNAPIVGEVYNLLPVEKSVVSENGSANWPIFLFTLALYFAAFHIYPAFRDDKVARILFKTGVGLWSVPAGIVGLIISVFWVISPREAFYWNFNLLIVNPFLLLMPAVNYYAERISKYAGYYFVILTALPLLGLAMQLIGILPQDIAYFAVYGVLVNGLYYYKHVKRFGNPFKKIG